MEFIQNDIRPPMPVQHTLHVPVGPGTGSQSIVINLGAVETDGNLGAAEPSTPPNGAAARPSVSGIDGTTLPSLRTVLKCFEGSLPFILIVFVKVMYDHRLGILVFAAMFGTMFHANSSLRRLIVQRETQHSSESATGLLWLIVFLTANICFIYYVFDDQKLYHSLYFVLPQVDKVSLWVMLWIAGTTDFVVKFLTVIIKACIALLPCHILSTKRKGKYYMLTEVLSQTYRCLLPITPWVYFIFDDEQNGRQWFSIVLLIVYIACKGSHLLGSFRFLRSSCAKFQVDLTYGTLPTRTQLESCDNLCPICHDKFNNPVALKCTHVFCEECVATWFNRERTCPMCRSNIVDSPQWRDGSTNISLQIY